MNDPQNLTQSKRLNLILNALRDIGKLIVTQTDRQELLNGICNILVEKRGYFNAWIGLLDEDNCLLMTAQAGVGKKFASMQKQIENKAFPVCIKQTLASNRVFSVIDPVVGCVDCILAENYAGRGAMAVRLTHGERNYGFMVLSVAKELSIDKNEKTLV